MVSEEELAAVAENARLALDDEDRAELQTDLQDILDAFGSLDDIDTEGVAPAFHPVDLDQDVRVDEREDCLDQLDAIMNSPDTNREDGFFKGPRAV